VHERAPHEGLHAVDRHTDAKVIHHVFAVPDRATELLDEGSDAGVLTGHRRHHEGDGGVATRARGGDLSAGVLEEERAARRVTLVRGLCSGVVSDTGSEEDGRNGEDPGLWKHGRL
jgi:hypothetical protein